MKRASRALGAASLLLAGLLFFPAAKAVAEVVACTPSDTKCGWTRLLTGESLGLSPFIRDMAVDLSGNLFLAGETVTATSGAGQSSSLITKFDSRGTPVWRQFLSAPGFGLNAAYAIDVDPAGNLCLAGVTDGAFEKGKGRRGGGFVARYDANGNRQWVVNTPNPPWMTRMDEFGSCHAASFTELIKYDPRGRQQWVYRGSIGAMAIGPGNRVYFTGQAGSMAMPFLAVLDSSGREISRRNLLLGKTLEWRQVDVRDFGLAVDGRGRVYLSGILSGIDRQGRTRIEAYLAQIDSSGAILWERHHGSNGFRWDVLHLAIDKQDNAYLVGRKTTIPIASPNDAFVVSYGANGTMRWARSYGTPEYDGAGRIGFDGYGNFYISGGTKGNLDGQINPLRGNTAQFISRNRPGK